MDPNLQGTKAKAEGQCLLLPSTLGAVEVEKEGGSLRTARGGWIRPAGTGQSEGFVGLKISCV